MQTLHQLQLEYLDLYLIHAPISASYKEGMEGQLVGGTQRRAMNGFGLQDTYRVLEQLVDEGKVKHIGDAFV